MRIRLPGVWVRRRRLHQDAFCGRQNSSQVQLPSDRSSRCNLRASEGALQALRNSAHPHSTTDNTEQSFKDREVGKELERKQHHHLEAFGTPRRENKENCFPMKPSAPNNFTSPPSPSETHNQRWRRGSSGFRLKNGARWAVVGARVILYFYRSKCSSWWRKILAGDN